MKASKVGKPMVQIAVIENDPVRSVGFRALLSSETDFDVQPVALEEIGTHQGADLVLLGIRPGKNVVEDLATLKAIRPRLEVIVTGSNLDDASILKIIATGAKGYINEGASVDELVRAIRTVRSGSVWASRRVLAMFVEQAYRSSRRGISFGERPFTMREKEVLTMLVSGCSNKEIAAPLGIEERTVKAHVSRLLRKAGMPNRVMLSVHAITHSLVALVSN